MYSAIQHWRGGQMSVAQRKKYPALFAYVLADE